MPKLNRKQLEALLDSMSLDSIINIKANLLKLDAETVDMLNDIGSAAALAGATCLNGDELTILTMKLDKLDGTMDGLVDGIPAFAVLGDVLTMGQLTSGSIYNYLIANHGQDAINAAFKEAAAEMAELFQLRINAKDLSVFNDPCILAMMLCLMSGADDDMPTPSAIIRDILGL